MANRKKVIPSTTKMLSLRQDLVVRAELMLSDPIEQRVPYGAFSTFIESLMIEHFRKLDEQQLDKGV